MSKLLTACLVLCCLFSCRESIDLEAIKGVNKSLEAANAALLEYNQEIERELHDKVLARRTGERASLWQSRAFRLGVLSKEVTAYIDHIKKGLSSGSKDPVQSVQSFRDNAGKALYDTLLGYSTRTQAVFDSSASADDAYLSHLTMKEMALLVREFAMRIGVSDSTVAKKIDAATWIKNVFPDNRHLLVQAMLNKLKNDVLVTENELLAYCDRQSALVWGEHFSIQPVVSMDRSYVKAGQRIEVRAGVGEFILSNQPMVTIDGWPVPVSDGAGIYRFVANQKPGKYKLPVTIEYTQFDGSRSEMETQVNYTVSK